MEIWIFFLPFFLSSLAYSARIGALNKQRTDWRLAQRGGKIWSARTSAPETRRGPGHLQLPCGEARPADIWNAAKPFFANEEDRWKCELRCPPNLLEKKKELWRNGGVDEIFVCSFETSHRAVGSLLSGRSTGTPCSFWPIICNTLLTKSHIYIATNLIWCQTVQSLSVFLFHVL